MSIWRILHELLFVENSFTILSKLIDYTEFEKHGYEKMEKGIISRK